MRLGNWRRFLVALVPGLVFGASAVGEDLGSLDAPVPVVDTNAPPPPEPITIEPAIEMVNNPICGLQPACGVSTGCGCCPLWTVQAGIIFLRRDSQDNLALTNGATPVTVGGLSFNDYQAGPMVTVI